jgi:hypothetical protein
LKRVGMNEADVLRMNVDNWSGRSLKAISYEL